MTTSPTARALTHLAGAPEVASAVAAAREACTSLRWHNALRRRVPQAAAESRVRGARASAALEGAEVAVGVVRELLMGATAWPQEPGPLERSLRGAVQATAETEHAGASVLHAPAQALARLHVAAASGMLDPGEVGRPRREQETSQEFVEAGEPVPAAELPARLAGLYDVIGAHREAPALVVAAIAHGEIAVMRPFVRGNGIVARAMERSIVRAAGLDPTGVAVPEAGHLREGAAGYAGALAAYASGTPEGVGLWLRFCAAAIERGAAEGMKISDAVLAGRLGKT